MVFELSLPWQFVSESTYVGFSLENCHFYIVTIAVMAQPSKLDLTHLVST